VNTTSQSWFHCGRCNALFDGSVNKKGSQHCSECGSIPYLTDEILAEPSPLARYAAARSSKPTRQSTRKRKKKHLTLKLFVAWALLIGLVIFAFKFNFQRPAPSVAESSDRGKALAISATDNEFISEKMPMVNQALAGFLAASTPEQRSQFVIAPIKTAPKMGPFYSSNPLLNLDPRTMSNSQRAVLNLPNAKAIEAAWKSTQGYTIDAVFIEEDAEWRLDWDHFVRYSTFPWELFLSGSGPEVGEFRLLARERLADERKDSESISLVFYPPRFGAPEEIGLQSPEFIVLRNSDDGYLIETAFEMEKSKKRVFGLNLPSPDPDGFIRVHVKVRRTESDGGRKFEIEKVIAGHWYSTTELGLALPDQAPAE